VIISPLFASHLIFSSRAGAQSTNARLLPGGNEERSMTNLSLARIMYGTNEDLHASHPPGAPASSSLAVPPVDENPEKTNAASEPDALGELLHKAWVNLTGKH
jgi:hypothetical protein